MKTGWRYIFLFILVFLLLFLLKRQHEDTSNHEHDSNHEHESKTDNLSFLLTKSKSILDGHEIDHIPPQTQHSGKYYTEDFIWKPIKLKRKWMMHSKHEPTKRASNCRMSNCFNWGRCLDVMQSENASLRIHVYPSQEEEETYLQSAHGYHNIYKTSLSYNKILNSIRSSIHFEPDAKKACLFVSRFDTLSRDPKDPFFIKLLNAHFYPLDDGRNHLIFNLFSGTWPDYQELDFLGFDPRKAILVKASCTQSNFRMGYDISLPLFDDRHPEKSPGVLFDPEDPSHDIKKKVLLVFKGKRYTKGIGSEARNALHHLHNDKDILMYTTCKHGKDWEKNRDDRCDQDNALYDTVDYQELMSQSTFCLVPRGRRADTYRFLEALSLGCIPVVLSNDLVKPFSEVIDWTQVVVQAEERLVFQLPETLRSIPDEEVKRMRIRCLAIYDTYFSSVEKIVMTVLNIMRDRIRTQSARTLNNWNQIQPGLSCDNTTLKYI